MKRLSGAFVLLVIVLAFAQLSAVERREEGNLVIEDIPEIPASIAERMMQYQNTRSAGLYGWDASTGGVVIATRFGETYQLHHVAAPGAARRQLTFFPEPVREAAVSPDPTSKTMLFTKDGGGNGLYQVFRYDAADGSFAMLTDGKGRHGGLLFSNKGDRYAHYSTARNDKDWDIYVASVADDEQKAEMVLAEGGLWFPVAWSPDDTRLLVAKYVSINESYYFILNIAKKELTPVNESTERISYGDVAAWSQDGQRIFLACDQDREFRTLREYDIASQSFTWELTSIEWDVEDMDISHAANTLAFVTNESGASKLNLLDTKTKALTRVADVPVGQVYGLDFHPDGARLAMVINTPKTPGDVFVYELATQRFERWTFSEVGGLNTETFVVPTLFEYETFDEVGGKPRKIPAFYFRPEGEGPYPVLVYIHGGPEGQFVPYFSSTIQYWVKELGIAVLAPNVRGSAGYGKSYLLLDNARKREDSVKDIGALLDWIAEQAELDEQRIAVMGGSYGGYMVLASMIHYNDRLRCGVDVVGISNFVTFLENTKEYRRDLRRVEYGDERDAEMREFLQTISPTTRAGEIDKPMLVVQGLNDPRVPASEAEQIVAAIRKNDVPVWYLLAKDEGHGFRKKSNRDYYTNAVVLFLETFLLDGGER